MYLVSGTLMEPTSIFSDVLRTIEARMRHLKSATQGRSYGTGHRTLYLYLYHGMGRESTERQWTPFAG